MAHPEKTADGGLVKGLSLWQATAINMIDMVGIGPFVVIGEIVALLHGPLSLAAWVLGAILAFMDGMVWAELGARWPEAGGSYVFLQKLFPEKGVGKYMAFLFIWQTLIQAPLVIASGAIGFSNYFNYLVPLSEIGHKVVSGLLVIALVMLLYRDIRSIGKISIALWIVTGGTILWLIFSGIGHTHWQQAINWDTSSFTSNGLLFAALGGASVKTMYSYLGYYNVCHLGGEIERPAKNIPTAIMLSVGGIAVLYLAMQGTILGNLPWRDIASGKAVASMYFEHVYGNRLAGQVATVLILIIAGASLFAAMLGYSRIPYAAARNGDFFAAFGRLHPRLKFPHISLLAIGGAAFVFSLLFRLSEVIAAILMMRIMIQFVSQAVGLVLLRLRHRNEAVPWKMPLFPLPALISLAIWLFIFFTNENKFKLFALTIIVTGTIAYFIRRKMAPAAPKPLEDFPDKDDNIR